MVFIPSIKIKGFHHSNQANHLIRSINKFCFHEKNSTPLFSQTINIYEKKDFHSIYYPRFY